MTSTIITYEIKMSVDARAMKFKAGSEITDLRPVMHVGKMTSRQKL